MQFTKQDLVQCQNLIKALKKGAFTLEGMEVLALAQAMQWLGKLEGVIAVSVEPPMPAMVPKEVQPPVQEAPQAAKPSRAPRAKKE